MKRFKTSRASALGENVNKPPPRPFPGAAGDSGQTIRDSFISQHDIVTASGNSSLRISATIALANPIPTVTKVHLTSER